MKKNNSNLEKELAALGVAATEGKAAMEKVADLEASNKSLTVQCTDLDEAFTKERKLRR